MAVSESVILPCHTSTGPVFVIGHARSGTSLMCRLLLDHLGVNFGTESQFIARYHSRLPLYGDVTDERRLRLLLQDISRERFFVRTRRNFGFAFDIDRAVRSIAPRTYANAVRAIFDQFAATKGHVRWGDKTPEYCRHLPLLRELFPDAQFLHIIRDGRDVAQSIFQTGFGPKNAYEAALAWKQTIGHVQRFRHGLPTGTCLEIRYEDLLVNPVRTLGTVASFLGIQNHGELMASIAPRLRNQVRAGNTSKWKERLTWREIECFEAFAGPELVGLGYTPQFRPRTGRPSVIEGVCWRAQGLWRRVSNRRYWMDNWYKLRLRIWDAALPLRVMARAPMPASANHLPIRRNLDS